MTTNIPHTLIPATVQLSLTVEEMAEVQEAFTLKDDGSSRGFPFKSLNTTNKGLWFIGLNDPLKYSVVQQPQVMDEDLRLLLKHDATRLDAYHEMFWTLNAETLWSQVFDTSMAALGNPNITPETAAWVLETIIETEPTGLTADAVCDVIGYQLFDKWSPNEFTVAALNELIRLFETHGVVENLPRLKRFARKAGLTR